MPDCVDGTLEVLLEEAKGDASRLAKDPPGAHETSQQHP